MVLEQASREPSAPLHTFPRALPTRGMVLEQASPQAGSVGSPTRSRYDLASISLCLCVVYGGPTGRSTEQHDIPSSVRHGVQGGGSTPVSPLLLGTLARSLDRMTALLGFVRICIR